MTTLLDVLPAQSPARARSIAWEKAWWVPLAVILAVQAVYSIRLIHLGYASPDESRYIYAGHQLIHELLHGGGSPYYETYFSGAPDFYSPMAAVADRLGGLAEVRLLSLTFMLAATMLLFLTTEHLFGRLAGLMAAGLFAGLGTTQVVGRNTIYDALAFMLIAAAAYCAVRSRDGRARWLLAVPALLTVAYFAKYMTILFVPVVIALAALGGTWRTAARRLIPIALATGALLALCVALAGGAYVRGMMFTVFERKTGADVILNAVALTTRQVVEDSWFWIGAVVAAGAAGALLALLLRHERRHVPTLLLCVVAGVLVTLEGVHLHSAESMRRHDDLSAWFACIAAGYALAAPVRLVKAHGARLAAGLTAVALVGLSWAHYGQRPGNFIGQWGYDSGYSPHAYHLYSALRPYLAVPGLSFLVSGDDALGVIYNDHIGLPWYRLFDDSYLKYPIPGRGGDWHGQARGTVCFTLKPGCMYLEGATAYRAAVSHHDFALISLTRPAGQSLSTDSAIVRAVARTPGYVQLPDAPHARQTWVYAPAYERRAHAG